MWVALLLLVLSDAWSAGMSSVPPGGAGGEEYHHHTWESMYKIAKSAGQSVPRSTMRTVMRILSEANVGSDCERRLMSFAMALLKGKTWALKMLDASGKIPGGILVGTVMDFGSFDECLKIRVNDSSLSAENNKEAFRGRYCMAGFNSHLLSPLDMKTSDGKTYVEAYGEPPEWAYEIMQKSGGYLKRVALWFGACIPSTCTEDDLRKILSRVSTPLGFNVTVKDCQIDEPFVWPSYSVVSVCILGILASFCALGTLIDVVSRWRSSNPSNREDDHLLLRVPKAFSLLTNTETLFRGSMGGSLTCLNGIRFLSATWIVLGHSYFYTDTWKYLKYSHLIGFTDVFNRNFPLAVIENFTIPVGSFFFMSGFLLVYTTWKVLEKNEGKFNLLLFFVHKVWRMTPALGLTIALLFCMPLLDSGPIWKSTINPPLEQCRNLWWANLLYINNLWRTDEYCMIHSWYLAALMQFHIVGIILLLVVYRWPIAGVLLGSIITVGCAVVTAFLVVKHDFPLPMPGFNKDMDLIEDYNSFVYVKPFNHFSSYLVGMVIGYIVLKYHKKKIVQKYQILGWTLAVLGGVSSVYGLYGPADHIAVRVLYMIGHRIGWALSLGWMVYACASGKGGFVNRFLSWSAMSPLGQLSYLTYLLHPLVIIYRNASLRERVYYGQTELVFSFISNLVVSLFMAFVGYVAVETPFVILDKMIFSDKSKVNFKKMEHKDSPVIVCAVKTLDP